MDECFVCGGSGPQVPCWDGSLACNINDCPDEPEITTVDVLYDSDADIYGFQFNIEGADVISASGGAAGDAEFTISNNSTTVIGFSLTGSYVSAGSGVLLTLDVVGDAPCLTDLVLSGDNGVSLGDQVDDCLTISYTAPCTDADEDGICDDEDDCVGEYGCDGVCNSGAVVDECDICGGNGSSCNNSITLSIGANRWCYGNSFR